MMLDCEKHKGTNTFPNKNNLVRPVNVLISDSQLTFQKKERILTKLGDDACPGDVFFLFCEPVLHWYLRKLTSLDAGHGVQRPCNHTIDSNPGSTIQSAPQIEYQYTEEDGMDECKSLS
jgi:hypothetical protein